MLVKVQEANIGAAGAPANSGPSSPQPRSST